MLMVHNLSKAFGIATVLKNITFNLAAGEKLGLVGPNGCGKTTLLRILAGQETADSGSFSFTPSNLKPGYLAQSLTVDAQESIGTYIHRLQGDLPRLSQVLQELALQLAVHPAQKDLQTRYDEVLAQIENLSISEGAVASTLTSFELDTLPQDLPVASLSGGQKTRLGLAGLLLSGSRLLLLDEPTNHLDFAMLEWLESWLKQSTASVLLVSHDRVFLDHMVSSILELDGDTHQAKMYAGNYSDYVIAKENEKAHHWQIYSDQQAEIQRLQTAAQHYRGLATFRKGSKADTPDKFAKGFFANRSLGTVQRAKGIEKRIEHLLTEEKIDKPRDSWQMKLKIENTPASSRLVLSLAGLSVGYGEKALMSGLDQSIRYGEHVLLIGPNGSGKSTLLRTLAGALPPLCGRMQIGASVHVGYMAQDQEENLSPDLTVLESLQRVASLNETNARTLLHKYLFSGDEALLPVAQCSFGMRSRLMLACLVAQGVNFLLLDEPLNHLDIPSRSQFEKALADFEGTILAVSHDRFFIQRFATQVWKIDRGHLFSSLPFWEVEEAANR